jgi:hypothetical protein
MSEPSDPVSPTASHHSAHVSFPSRAPQVHHLPVLKADLKKVAASHGNVHARKVAILVRWENDTTGAEEDISTMGKVMETFRHPVYRLHSEKQRTLPHVGIFKPRSAS